MVFSITKERCNQYPIKLTTDEKGKASTHAVGLTGSACKVRAPAKKGMIYRCDITVSAEGFQEALPKTFFDCKKTHPEASFHPNSRKATP
jgi:hypothetical protein